jgi:hypothetical protein
MFTRLADFTSPGSVTNIRKSRPVLNGPITLTWENPADEDLSGVRIVRTTTGKADLVGLRRGSVPLNADGGWLYDPEEDVWVVTPEEGATEVPTTFEDTNPPAGMVYYTLVAFDGHLHHTYPVPETAVAAVDSLELGSEGPGTHPRDLVLGSVSPNPAGSGHAVITYSLPQAGTTRLAIYEVSGRCVRTLQDGELPAGSFTARWDLADAAGAPVGNGVYVCRLEQAGLTATGNLVVLR